MTVVWIALVAFWLLSGALVTIVSVWMNRRHLNKLLEEYRRDTQKYISMSEAEALPKTTGEKLYSAWLEKIDEDMEREK